MTVYDAQIGVAKESVWGTPVTVTKFLEFNSEGIEEDWGRTESAGLHAGVSVQREDRFTPWWRGAEGDIEFDVMTKGFSFWLEHMLGAVATAGPTDSAYTHTGTMGTLDDGFTCQVYRPYYRTGGQAFTYAGGKVNGWELSNSVEGNLVAKLDLTFAAVSTVTAKATASYPSGMENFSWAGGVVTIGGSSVDVTEISISGDNKLEGDRYIRGNTAGKEPFSKGLREVAFSIKCDWESMTQYNRVASATAAGAVATIVGTWTGPTLIGTTTYPKVIATIHSARFDEIKNTVDGPDPLTQELTGVGLGPAAGTTPITIAVTTADTTP